MKSDPLQTDLEDLLHYQNLPQFIGPRLPMNHPAYRAHLVAQVKPAVKGLAVRHCAVTISAADLNAATTDHGANVPYLILDAVLAASKKPAKRSAKARARKDIP